MNVLQPLSEDYRNFGTLTVSRDNECVQSLRQHWVSPKGAFHQSFDDRNQSNDNQELSNSCVDLSDSVNFDLSSLLN
ncbi:unnamed protein product [Thelazia callipaeda]|uniref:Uncharacterized protein n=1 Tax=Thelazia callipaeda TaxID=103827 RepID=A0A0N5CTG6_THECL|nr:unnamed protein product [Thelazia callipaeda]